jgi:two-component sensor histidine kinase
VSNDETKKILDEYRNRIQSMALLHEILYQSKDLATVDFSKYVLRMVHHLFLCYGVDPQRILLQTELDTIGLELDDALPLGLLISEAVSNSLKHAFPDGKPGEVRIFLRRQSEAGVALTLSDNGVGLPEGLDWATSPTLGLRLVQVLAGQLHASVKIESHCGTQISLVFAAKTKATARHVQSIAGSAP